MTIGYSYSGTPTGLPYNTVSYFDAPPIHWYYTGNTFSFTRNATYTYSPQYPASGGDYVVVPVYAPELNPNPNAIPNVGYMSDQPFFYALGNMYVGPARWAPLFPASVTTSSYTLKGVAAEIFWANAVEGAFPYQVYFTQYYNIQPCISYTLPNGYPWVFTSSDDYFGQYTLTDASSSFPTTLDISNFGTFPLWAITEQTSFYPPSNATYPTKVTISVDGSPDYPDMPNISLGPFTFSQKSATVQVDTTTYFANASSVNFRAADVYHVTPLLMNPYLAQTIPDVVPPFSLGYKVFTNEASGATISYDSSSEIYTSRSLFDTLVGYRRFIIFLAPFPAIDMIVYDTLDTNNPYSTYGNPFFAATNVTSCFFYTFLGFSQTSPQRAIIQQSNIYPLVLPSGYNYLPAGSGAILMQGAPAITITPIPRPSLSLFPVQPNNPTLDYFQVPSTYTLSLQNGGVAIHTPDRAHNIGIVTYSWFAALYPTPTYQLFKYRYVEITFSTLNQGNMPLYITLFPFNPHLRGGEVRVTSGGKGQATTVRIDTAMLDQYSQVGLYEAYNEGLIYFYNMAPNEVYVIYSITLVSEEKIKISGAATNALNDGLPVMSPLISQYMPPNSLTTYFRLPTSDFQETYTSTILNSFYPLYNDPFFQSPVPMTMKNFNNVTYLSPPGPLAAPTFAFEWTDGSLSPQYYDLYPSGITFDVNYILPILRVYETWTPPGWIYNVSGQLAILFFSQNVPELGILSSFDNYFANKTVTFYNAASQPFAGSMPTPATMTNAFLPMLLPYVEQQGTVTTDAHGTIVDISPNDINDVANSGNVIGFPTNENANQFGYLFLPPTVNIGSANPNTGILTFPLYWFNLIFNPYYWQQIASTATDHGVYIEALYDNKTPPTSVINTSDYVLTINSSKLYALPIQFTSDPVQTTPITATIYLSNVCILQDTNHILHLMYNQWQTQNPPFYTALPPSSQTSLQAYEQVSQDYGKTWSQPKKLISSGTQFLTAFMDDVGTIYRVFNGTAPKGAYPTTVQKHGDSTPLDQLPVVALFDTVFAEDIKAAPYVPTAHQLLIAGGTQYTWSVSIPNYMPPQFPLSAMSSYYPVFYYSSNFTEVYSTNGSFEIAQIYATNFGEVVIVQVSRQGAISFALSHFPIITNNTIYIGTPPPGYNPYPSFTVYPAYDADTGLPLYATLRPPADRPVLSLARANMASYHWILSLLTIDIRVSPYPRIYRYVSTDLQNWKRLG